LIWHNVGRRRLILPVLLGLWLYRSGDRLVPAVSDIRAVFRGPPYFPRRRTAPRLSPRALPAPAFARRAACARLWPRLHMPVWTLPFLIRRILFLDEIR
jgi:hypothetical protein